MNITAGCYNYMKDLLYLTWKEKGNLLPIVLFSVPYISSIEVEGLMRHLQYNHNHNVMCGLHLQRPVLASNFLTRWSCSQKLQMWFALVVHRYQMHYSEIFCFWEHLIPKRWRQHCWWSCTHTLHQLGILQLPPRMRAQQWPFLAF